MASRLGHTSKLKSSSRRKSPTASRSTTPNTSQSSIPSDAKDALVDEVLQGDEIEALRVKEEELKKVTFDVGDGKRERGFIYFKSLHIHM